MVMQMVGSVCDLELAELNPESGAGISVSIYDGRGEYAVPSCIGTDCITDVRYNNRTNKIIIKTGREKRYILRIKSSGNGIKTKVMKIQ